MKTNRVYSGKTHGLIVDYLGIFDDVVKTLNYDDKSAQKAITNIHEALTSVIAYTRKFRDVQGTNEKGVNSQTKTSAKHWFFCKAHGILGFEDPQSLPTMESSSCLGT